MSLERLLSILRRNTYINVLNEGGDQLYKGPVWYLNSKYLLSCLVLDVYKDNFCIVIVIIDD